MCERHDKGSTPGVALPIHGLSRPPSLLEGAESEGFSDLNARPRPKGGEGGCKSTSKRLGGSAFNLYKSAQKKQGEHKNYYTPDRVSTKTITPPRPS